MKNIVAFLICLSPILVIGNGTNFLFNDFTIENGLPENTIVEIIQDPNLYIWIATENGLSRFDGTHFKNYFYQQNNNNSISSNFIIDLFVDSKGTLWVGTLYGICKYNPVLDNFDRYIPSPNFTYNSSHNKVQSISETSKGEILFLVETGQLFSIKSDMIEMELNLQQDACKLMIIDDKDQCWIPSKNKLYRFNIENNLTTQFNISFLNKTKEPEINDMVIIGNSIFMTNYRSDLIKYNYITDTSTYFNIVPEDSEQNTSCLYLEGQNLYIGTSDYGFAILDLKNLGTTLYQQDVKNSMSITSNGITDFLKDHQGNLWVGTSNAGINVAYKNTGFEGYSFDFNNFHNNTTVESIAKDSLNRLWLGYSSMGFEIFDKNYNSIKATSNIRGLLPSSVLGPVFCFYNDGFGNMWIGTYTNGVLKYAINTSAIAQYYPNLKNGHHIDGQDIRCIKADKKGNIWIAIHGKGLNVKKKNSHSFIPLTEFDPNIPDNINRKWVFDMEFDEKGNLWLGTSLGAFYYNFKTQEYLQYHKDGQGKYKLHDNGIISVYIDSRKNVWLAGYNGVNVLIHNTGENLMLNAENGLPINKVMAILEDDQQNVWLSSKYGISEVELKSKNRCKITNYKKRHGLNTNEFWANSAYSDGEKFYFGGKTGFTVFNPEEIQKDTVPPKVVLTNMYLFDKEVKISTNNDNKLNDFVLDKHINNYEKIKINALNNSIGFSFSGLSFSNYNKKYKYKLEGFNSDWVSVNDRNVIYFTNLKPGDYTLRIKCSSGDGNWGEESKNLAISIVPPFWKSKSALLFYILVVVLVVLYLRKLSIEKERMRLVVQQQDQLRELRTRFFMNISHELKTPLSLITVPLKKIVEEYRSTNKAPNYQDINMIYRNTNRIMRIINQIFDFRKIELNKLDMKVEKGNIVEFTEAILDYFNYQIQQKNIRVITDFKDRTLSFYFDPDKMDKIIFNLFSNALKYTPENGTIIIRIGQKSQKTTKRSTTEVIEWSIKDSGKGIPAKRLESIFDRFSPGNGQTGKEKGGTGIGLSIVKEFTELHKGNIQIESNDFNESTFTKVTLNFPIDENLYSAQQAATTGTYKELTNNYKLMQTIKTEPNTESLITGKTFELQPRDKEHSVLIVDDEIEVCNLLEAELSACYKVHTAYNGKNGLFKAEKYLPDVVVSDIMMPEMDGYELCKAIKTNLETSHIPVLLLTAKSTSDDRIEAYSTGADGFISKPFDLDVLTHRIDSLITNREKLKSTFLSNFGIKLQTVVPTQTDERFMKELIHLINNNIAEKNLNVDKITRELGISRSQLYIKIKSVANTSVNLFIRSIRMRRAAQLLAAGGMNITEVAYAVGFDNLPYFSKCFQEEFGKSPSKYASSHQVK